MIAPIDAATLARSMARPKEPAQSQFWAQESAFAKKEPKASLVLVAMPGAPSSVLVPRPSGLKTDSSCSWWHLGPKQEERKCQMEERNRMSSTCIFPENEVIRVWLFCVFGFLLFFLLVVLKNVSSKNVNL